MRYTDLPSFHKFDSEIKVLRAIVPVIKLYEWSLAHRPDKAREFVTQALSAIDDMIEDIEIWIDPEFIRSPNKSSQDLEKVGHAISMAHQIIYKLSTARAERQDELMTMTAWRSWSQDIESYIVWRYEVLDGLKGVLCFVEKVSF